MPPACVLHPFRRPCSAEANRRSWPPSRTLPAPTGDRVLGLARRSPPHVARPTLPPKCGVCRKLSSHPGRSSDSKRHDPAAPTPFARTSGPRNGFLQCSAQRAKQCGTSRPARRHITAIHLLRDLPCQPPPYGTVNHPNHRWIWPRTTATSSILPRAGRLSGRERDRNCSLFVW